MREIDISCFSCSRGRVELLKESITRMFELANHPEKIEYVVRIDCDDDDTIHFLTKDEYLKRYKNIRVYVGPRVGYGYSHLVFKQLLKVLRGDIFCPYSDDSMMRGEGYDDRWRKFKGQTVVFGKQARLAFTREAVDSHPIIANWNDSFSGGDGAIWKYACAEGIYKKTYKLWGKKQPIDQVHKDAKEGWKPADLSILDNLEFRELEREL